MGKLVERFERLIWESTPGAGYLEDLDISYVTRDCVKEAMKLAIEYKWWSVSQPVRIFNINELPEGMDIEDFLKIRDEEQFNKFVEEYYK
jgi:hypothetical protein